MGETGSGGDSPLPVFGLGGFEAALALRMCAPVRDIEVGLTKCSSLHVPQHPQTGGAAILNTQAPKLIVLISSDFLSLSPFPRQI